MPYLLAHGEGGASSVLWVNAADTWVDLISSRSSNDNVDGERSTTANFLSESGALELFFFGSLCDMAAKE